MIGVLIRIVRHERRGSAAVEMALVTPILTLLLFAGIDLARGFSARLDLEQAASRAIEFALIRGPVNADYAYVQNEAMAASGQPAGNVLVTNWLECNAVRNASFTASCPTGQQTARYVSVFISKTYVPIFGWMGLTINSAAGGNIVIEGDAVVRVQ